MFTLYFEEKNRVDRIICHFILVINVTTNVTVILYFHCLHIFCDCCLNVLFRQMRRFKFQIVYLISDKTFCDLITWVMLMLGIASTICQAYMSCIQLVLVVHGNMELLRYLFLTKINSKNFPSRKNWHVFCMKFFFVIR